MNSLRSSNRFSGPLTDNERSYNRTLVQKRCSQAELMYINAKFSKFLFSKQYELGPLLSKIDQPASDSSFTLINPPNNPTPPSNTMHCFHLSIDRFINEILTLLKHHVDYSLSTNPLDFLKNY